ncbi:hypothetical protein A0J61_00640 [Choanephora cucurbitarum]|uniref:Uncharacterized protein n=1 Tax=Choanephora cucurbitarum TaxID=101091 RepID=A0A1C7NQC8_9FUNG|nr:hypothetical protein A0J61_00640 [Choanephora cucurbitarum]
MDNSYSSLLSCQDQLKQANLHIDIVSYNAQYTEEEDITDDDSDVLDPISCGCGKVLSSGWLCSDCRTSCKKCHRALANGEACGRCCT